MRYLSDRRPKIAGALTAFHITPMQSHEMPHLSATSKEDLLNLPNAPLASLSPEELVRFAQIVDTALFKSYLLVRPGLLASLCRVGWCVSCSRRRVIGESVGGLDMGVAMDSTGRWTSRWRPVP